MAGTDDLVGFGSPAAWGRAFRLVTRALTHRWKSIAGFALVFLAVGASAAALLPRSYSTQATLLIKKNYVMPALANPKRAVPTGAESPTQSASQAVLSRPSLEGIIRTTHLIARWDRERAPLLRFKDRVVAAVRGPVPESEKVDVLADILEKHIIVDVQDEVVTVKAMWGNRETARDLVNAAVAAFLAARRKLEVQTIRDTREILQRMADIEHAQMGTTLANVIDAQRQYEDAFFSKAAARATVRPVAVGARRQQDDGLAGLRADIASVRSTRAVIEKRQQEGVLELEAKLAERRSSQTERHPDIVAMKQTLQRLREEPQELVAAKADESRLLDEYRARGGSLARVGEAPPAPVAVPASIPAAADLPVSLPKGEEDDTTVYARSLFKGALDNYQDVMERLRNVEIELATAEASFGYRYTVTAPSRLPKKPDSPNVVLMIAGALVAGLAGGAILAVFRELQALSLLSPAALIAHVAGTPAELVRS